jgi:cyclophilin family peptidyl-prolyl cis-trans isomerase
MEAPQVQIDTSMGSFTVELYYKHAPRTVKNFLELSKRGYYDGVKVSRCSLSGPSSILGRAASRSRES